MPETPLVLSSKPGVQRDGTRITGDYCTDSEWMRFNNLGKPRKMGGYAKVSQLAAGPVYGFEVFSQGAIGYVFSGSSNGVEVQQVTTMGAYSSGPANRTPAGLGANPNYVWSMDSMYDSAGSPAQIVLAHPGQNLNDIDSNITTSTYYGLLATTSNLVDCGAPQSSGGVVVFHPYAFVYGSDGQVAWSDAGLPATWTTSVNVARICQTKIVYGAPTRGGAGQAPAGLFWSLDAVVRCTFTGGSTTFNFDTVTAESSIMSSRCVVEMDGVFYWIGVGKFFRYNGVVQELPNFLNINDFFDNINLNYRQKVWATKITRWGEVWWFYVRGSEATECNHAIIYNTRLQTWYDTPIPESGRSDGFYSQVIPNPIWCGVEPDALGKYAFWLQERQGSYDKIDGGVTSAIRSFFTTQDLNYKESGRNNNMRITRVELDLNQTGDMTVSRIGYAYPRDNAVTSSADFSPNETKVDGIRGQARYLYMNFESNVAGGYYEMGDTTLWIDRGDERPVGG